LPRLSNNPGGLSETIIAAAYTKAMQYIQDQLIQANHPNLKVEATGEYGRWVCATGTIKEGELLGYFFGKVVHKDKLHEDETKFIRGHIIQMFAPDYKPYYKPYYKPLNFMLSPAYEDNDGSNCTCTLMQYLPSAEDLLKVGIDPEEHDIATTNAYHVVIPALINNETQVPLPALRAEKDIGKGEMVGWNYGRNYWPEMQKNGEHAILHDKSGQPIESSKMTYLSGGKLTFTPEADRLCTEGVALFKQEKHDESIEKYNQALALIDIKKDAGIFLSANLARSKQIIYCNLAAAHRNIAKENATDLILYCNVAKKYYSKAIEQVELWGNNEKLWGKNEKSTGKVKDIQNKILIVDNLLKKESPPASAPSIGQSIFEPGVRTTTVDPNHEATLSKAGI
jgi:hypothetical protein